MEKHIPEQSEQGKTEGLKPCCGRCWWHFTPTGPNQPWRKVIDTPAGPAAKCMAPHDGIAPTGAFVPFDHSCASFLDPAKAEGIAYPRRRERGD